MPWYKWNRVTDETKPYADFSLGPSRDYLMRMTRLEEEFGDPVLFEHNRRVAHTMESGLEISTVFLALDHGWGSSEPILFETIIFGADYMRRYHTGREALAYHQQLVKVIRLCMKAPMISQLAFKRVLGEL